MSLVDRIRTESKRQGTAKGEIFFVKANEASRVRFLIDIEQGLEIEFYNEFGGLRIPSPALWDYPTEILDERADDNDDKLKREIHYGWPIWNYDRERVQLLHGKPNQWSPVMQLLSAYEEYGSIVDRDFNIRRQGEGLETSYSLFPGDKKPFKVRKAKKPTKAAMLEILWKAYGVEGELAKLGISNEDPDEDYDDDDDWDDDDE
jgi:hypothetical protein